MKAHERFIWSLSRHFQTDVITWVWPLDVAYKTSHKNVFLPMSVACRSSFIFSIFFSTTVPPCSDHRNVTHVRFILCNDDDGTEITAQLMKCVPENTRSLLVMIPGAESYTHLRPYLRFQNESLFSTAITIYSLIVLFFCSLLVAFWPIVHSISSCDILVPATQLGGVMFRGKMCSWSSGFWSHENKQSCSVVAGLLDFLTIVYHYINWNADQNSHEVHWPTAIS